MSYISRHLDCSWEFLGKDADDRALFRCREHGQRLAIGTHLARSLGKLPEPAELPAPKPALPMRDLGHQSTRDADPEP